MAINRYDKPAEAQFINTYSPVPFDELLKVGMLKQARVEKGQEGMDAINQAMGAIKVTPADEEAYNAKVAASTKQLDDALKYGVGSQDQINAVNRIKNSLVSDPDFRKWTHNYGVYTDALKQKQEATQKNALSANTMELDNILKTFSKGGGGSAQAGLANTGSWSENVDYRKRMEESVDNVKESLVGRAGIIQDSGNKYILDRETGGITLNALGAPLGIKFSTNEKGEAVVDLDGSAINTFLQSDYGQQIKRIAAERAGGDQATFAKEVQKLYYDTAKSIIEERVSSKSTMKLAADPFDQARYKDELENQVNTWGTPTSIATSASKLVSFNKTEEAKNTIKAQTATKEQDFADYQKLEGVRETTTTYKDKEGKEVSYKVFLDKNGKDVSEAYNSKQLEIEQLKGQAKSIEDMVARVKGEIGIPQTWEIDPNVAKEGEDVRAAAEQKSLLALTNAQGRVATPEYKQNPTPEERAIAAKAGQAAYDEYVGRKDSTWGKLNAALKANAEKSSAITNITPFGKKTLNERAMAVFPQLMENEVQWVGNKESFTDKEKGEVGGLTANQSTTKPERVIFAGTLMDPESQKVKMVYQSYNAKGKLSEPFMVDAPSGVVDDLIKSGSTTMAKQIIHQQMTLLESNPDKVTQVTLGTGENTKGIVRKVQPSGERLRDQYLLTVNLKGADGVVRSTELPFPDRTSLIDYYESYVMTSLTKK
jgi:hypothetical protein